MTSINETMTKAYALIQKTGQPLSFETNCIQNMFILPSRIAAFRDDPLFLHFIDALLQERNNVSFPENVSEYDAFFTDCIQLKEQMCPFSESTWLTCIIHLFENLKTPFYGIYAATMRSLQQSFRDHALFQKILQDFYSVLIKSSPDNQKLAEHIAGASPVYREYCRENENLLADILRFQLACFASEKKMWLVKLFEEMYTDTVSSPEDIHIPALLAAFQEREIAFLSSMSPSMYDMSSREDYECDKQTKPDIPSAYPEYLARRTVYFYENATKAPENIFTAHRQRHMNSSVLSTDSILRKYAYNMTAATYITNPAIGREAELEDLELILISPKKSPILLGEAGVGKTAVAEGLAWLLQQGKVPKLLKQKELYKLTTTSLLSGTKYVGEMEERIRQLMEELAKHPDIILFIDEIHTIVGAGSTESSNNDISNMLKPYIDRGDIKIIGSTTSEEYRQYLLSDKALARRFYPITIEEPDEETTLRILLGTIPSVEQETGVKNTFSREETLQLLRILIHLSAEEYQPEERRTRRPELPLTLMEMAFSYAALQSRDAVSVEDYSSAVRHTNLLKSEVKQKAEQYFYQCTTTGYVDSILL